LYVLWLCRPDIKQLLRHTHVYCVTPEAVNGKARLNVENADGQFSENMTLSSSRPP